MNIDQIDRSNYFKGLLILIGTSRKITETERIIISDVAEILGFGHNFVDTAMDELFGNQYIIAEPPRFSNHILAEIFIRDGMRIAFANKVLHLYELQWLARFAVNNNFSKQWFFIELEQYLDKSNQTQENSFEIQKYIN
jgi:hypothetical protein